MSSPHSMARSSSCSHSIVRSCWAVLLVIRVGAGGPYVHSTGVACGWIAAPYEVFGVEHCIFYIGPDVFHALSLLRLGNFLLSCLL